MLALFAGLVCLALLCSGFLGSCLLGCQFNSGFLGLLGNTAVRDIRHSLLLSFLSPLDFLRCSVSFAFFVSFLVNFIKRCLYYRTEILYDGVEVLDASSLFFRNFSKTVNDAMLLHCTQRVILR